MKILGIGETIIDSVYLIDEINNPKLVGENPARHIGGPVPVALIVLSRLGIDCTLVTSLGHDDNANIIRKTFKKEKIKLLHKLQKKTKTNIILVNKITGERKKLRGATIHPDIKNLNRKFIRQFDVIIIDRHEKTAFYEIINKKRPETKVIIDPSIEISQFTLDMIKLADYPILPIESLTKVGVKNIKASLNKLYILTKKNLIVTAGDKGSIIYDGERLELISAYDIDAIDATGAGDVYRGAFAYGVINNWDIVKSVSFANFVSGLQCMKVGNLAAIPTNKEMKVFEMIYKKHQTNISVIKNYFQTLFI